MSNQGSAASPAPGRTRRYTRHRLDARIQMSVFRDGATISLWGCTSELGQDGVGATLSAQLKVGEVVSMEFPIPVPSFPRVRLSRGIVNCAADSNS